MTLRSSRALSSSRLPISRGRPNGTDSFLEHAPGPSGHHQDPVREHDRLGHAVGHQQHAHRALLDQPFEEHAGLIRVEWATQASTLGAFPPSL